MKNHKEAAHRGQQIIITKLIIPRMAKLGITNYKLSQLSGISQSTIGSWINGKQNITLVNYLQILGALGVRPYFEYSEGDDLEMVREHFN